ncbi:putative RNA-directed DNA polymerase [Helianthus annuus]|nr:putative RNA-directed DNA polymerase [Helianthus annuus]KAJ0938208.1 putative RNA-directed DNA polymerase [Helianthus annuus]
MVWLKKRCMSNNLRVLKILFILIGFGYLTMLSTDYIKHRELGTQPYLTICWRMVFTEVLLIALFSSKKRMEIFCWFRDFERFMQEKFEMSAMGEMNFFLGLQVQQMESGIFIHQTKYVSDILSRFQMSEATPIGTPLPQNHRITPDLKGESVNSSLYRAMIGSLMYLTASRPKIMYPTCLLARYQANPTTSHLAAVKRIFRFLKGCLDTGLWYPRGDSFDLIAFNDSDFGGCKIDGKPTTDGCQFLGNRLVT